MMRLRLEICCREFFNAGERLCWQGVAMDLKACRAQMNDSLGVCCLPSDGDIIMSSPSVCPSPNYSTSHHQLAFVTQLSSLKAKGQRIDDSIFRRRDTDQTDSRCHGLPRLDHSTSPYDQIPRHCLDVQIGSITADLLAGLEIRTRP